jgi:L-malate glycosyltransferase
MRKSLLRVALLADASHVNTQCWYEGLSRADASIQVLSFTACPPDVMRTHQLPFRQLPGKLYYIAAVPYVRRLMSIIKPHVVVAYYTTGYGTLGALAGHQPLVQVTSGSDVLLAPRNPIMRSLVRFNLSRADLVTTWAPHMAEAARQLGVREERMLVMPRGIPLQRFASNRCLPPRNNELLRIISTRSLEADYNFDLLLKSARILGEYGVPFSLTIAGDGPKREELVALAQRLGLYPQVQFAGFVHHDQLPTLLARHNLYISLVHSDGISASLLEAMATGLFPVVPNHPANRHWIKHGENGWLLDDLSPVTIARAIREAISDTPLRQRAWQQNLAIVRNRADLYSNSEAFVEHFRRLASNYRSDRGYQSCEE